MRTLFVFLIGIVLFPLTVRAEPVDSAKIRAAIALPRMDLQAGFSIQAADKNDPNGKENESPQQRVERIRGELTKQPNSLTLLLALAGAYHDAKDGTEAQIRYREAVERAKTASKGSPKDGQIQFTLARAYLGLGDFGEAEEAARKSVQLDKTLWRARFTLAEVLIAKAAVTVFHDPALASKRGTLVASILANDPSVSETMVRLLGVKTDDATLVAARKMLDEADAEVREATKETPRDPELYKLRASHSISFAGIKALTESTGQTDPQASRELLARTGQIAMLASYEDWARAAALVPSEPQVQLQTCILALQWVSFAGAMEGGTGFTGNADDPQLSKAIRGLRRFFSKTRADAQMRFDECFSRLKALSEGQDRKSAVEAWEGIALIKTVQRDPVQAQLAAKRAIERGPFTDRPYVLFAAMSLALGKQDQVIEVLEKRVKAVDSVKLRLILAKIYDQGGKSDLAKDQIARAAKLEPNSVEALLFQIALTLRTPENEAKAVALTLLQRTKEKIKKTPGQREVREYQILSAAFLALYGDAAEARRMLDQALLEEPDHPGAKSLLDALPA